jgi:type I restriction enzyme S subunit
MNHWPRKRLRFLLNKAIPTASRKLMKEAGEVTFLPMEAIGEQGELDTSRLIKFDEASAGYTLFFDGDVVVAKITPCFENGKGALIEATKTGLGLGTTEFYVLRPGTELDGKYLYYVTADPAFRILGETQMTGAAGQKRVPEDFVRDYPVAALSVFDQTRISRFLDTEIGDIDTLISSKAAWIDLLAEKRRAIVAEAVMRGINPSAPLRPSGIDWLGDTPAHWEAIPLRFLVSFSGGATPDTRNLDYWSGAIPWVSPKDMKRDFIDDAEDHVSEAALANSALKMIEPDAILIVVRGMILAHSFPTAINTVPVTINQDMKALRCAERISPAFLVEVLKGAKDYLVSLADSSAHGTKKLETEALGRFEVPVPPIDEQLEIVRHIATETAKIDRLSAATEQSITLLKERRGALIAAAVTGQIDIPEEA